MVLFLKYCVHCCCRPFCVSQTAPQQLTCQYRLKCRPQRDVGMVPLTRRGQCILCLTFPKQPRLLLRLVFKWVTQSTILKLSLMLTLWLQQVSVEGLQQRKVIEQASSPSGSYLYLSFNNKIYSVGEQLTIDYNSVNYPKQGFIYYMVRHV